MSSRIVRDAQFDYMLDCGVELGEITPLEAAVFCADNSAAMALSNALNGEDSGKDFMRTAARGYLDQLGTKERLVWALKGLEGMEYSLNALRDRMGSVLQKKVQGDLGLDESKHVSWLHELSGAQQGGPKLFETVHDVSPDRALEYLGPIYNPVLALIERDLELAVEAIAWLKQPGARAEARAIAKRLFAVANSRRPVGLQLPKVSLVTRVVQQKKLRNQARGAIKKALALFTSFGMEKNVQMLVSGKTVTLCHPDSPFKLEVAPLQECWLEAKTVAPGGHVPFRLSLMTKEGVFLSRLCVIFAETPVLDQLFGLAMMVQTGHEMELLQKANWFGYSDSGVVREILAEKAPSLVNKLPDPDRRSRGVIQDPHLLRFNELQLHWEPFKAPVQQWIGDWFSPAVQTLRLLKAPGSSVALI
jgi:hypothetical protein